MYDDFLGDNFPLNNDDFEDAEFENIDEESNKVDDEVLRQMVEKDIIMAMENNIETLGHKRTWEIIERFRNPMMRGRYRKYFFKAGGVMPEKEI